MVEVRRIEDPQQPLRVGVGVLPNWLRHKKGLNALDQFDDELCVSRCIAVYQGADRRFNTRKVRELAESFFAAHDIPNRKISRRHFPLIENIFSRALLHMRLMKTGHLRGNIYPFTESMLS